MEEILKRLLDAVEAARSVAHTWRDDGVMRVAFRRLVSDTVSVARRFCALTGRVPSEFDERLGLHEFMEDE